MKHLLLTTIAALVLVGCGPSVPDISIHGAAAIGNIQAVKQHFEAGMDLNAKEDVYGATPLHMAAANGNKKIAEFLITKGADLNARNEFGATPLRHAVGKGHKEIAEMLIAAGADVNWIGKQAGTTLLHEASIKGQKEVAKLLIAKGVNINAKVASGPKQGLTALDAAHETNHPETADLLRKHGGKTGEELKANRISD